MIIPTIFQTQPDHSHIKLHSLKLRPAMKFMDQLHEYLTEHRIALRIPNLVVDDKLSVTELPHMINHN
jgi:hypothetical protein